MKKVGGKRNYGYGKQLHYAGKQALLDYYGTGKYATRATHAERWQQFVYYLKENNINDTRKIEKHHIQDYAEQLQNQVESGEKKVSYAQNLLSTVNVILCKMRNDNALKISPKSWVGQRHNIRTTVPKSLNHHNASHYYKVIAYLQQHGDSRVATIALLNRYLGLRRKEASLLNPKHTEKAISHYQKANITEGTKGGRGKHIDRWIPINPAAHQTIQQARTQQTQKTGANRQANLIPNHMTLKQWKDHCYRQWNQANQAVAKQAGLTKAAAEQIMIKGFHDMRAAYACERYQQITGYPAPVVHPQQHRTAPKPLDKEARQIISAEMGHSRVNVMLNYIGSTK